MGSAEGLSPFAGSLRVSLRYKFLPFLTRKGTRGMVERVFQRPARSLWPIARAEEVLPSPPLFRRRPAHLCLRLQPPRRFCCRHR